MTIRTTARAAGPFPDSAASLPFAFKVFRSSDMLVTSADPLGAPTVLVNGVDYRVTLNADQETTPGGVVTLLTATPAGHTVTVTTAMPALQPLDLQNQGGFNPEVVEDAFDRLTVLVQQLGAGTLGSAAPGTFSLPAPEANMVLGWAPDGSSLTNIDPCALGCAGGGGGGGGDGALSRAAFYAVRTAPAYESVAAGERVLPLNSQLLSSGGGGWSGSAYTVPRSGMYQIAFRVTAQRGPSSAAWSYFVARLKVNGTTQIEGSCESTLSSPTSDALFFGSYGEGTLSLTAGDTLELAVMSEVGCEVLAGSQNRSTGISIVELWGAPNAFAAAKATPATTALSVGEADVAFDSTLVSQGAGTWSGTEFTVAKAGMYQVAFTVTAERAASSTTWGYFIGSVYVNGVRQLTGSCGSAAPGSAASVLFKGSSGSGMLQLSVGDKVKIRAQTDSACNVIAGSSGRSTRVSLVEVADPGASLSVVQNTPAYVAIAPGDATVGLDDLRSNIGGGAWSGSAYTVPKSGLYMVAFRVTAQRSSRTAPWMYFSAYVAVNGVSQIHGGSEATSSGSAAAFLFAAASGGAVLRLAAGDSLALKVLSSTDCEIIAGTGGRSTGLTLVELPDTGGGGGSGVTTASNLGAGQGTFAAKVGNDLRFKSLVAGPNVTLSSNGDSITIGASGGGGGGAPVAFSAVKTSPASTYVPATSETKVAINLVQFNDGGGTWSSNEYTVPETGTYQIAFRVTAQRSASGDAWMYYVARLNVNGTAQIEGNSYAKLSSPGSGTLFVGSTGAGTLKLTAGDKVSLWLLTDSACEILAGSAQRSTGLSLVNVTSGSAPASQTFPRVKVVVIGDSMAAQQGLLADSWPERWAVLMRNAGVPIDMTNLAVGGWTFNKANTISTSHGGKTVVQRAIDLKPDVVFVGLGANDAVLNVEGRTLAQTQSDANSFFSTLRAGLPAAVVIACNEYLHDSTNFPTPGTTLKNKGVIPYLMDKPSSGILTGCYSAEILETTVNSTQRTQFANWVSLMGTVNSHAAVNGNLTLNLWRASRVGLLGTDGVHATAAGQQFLAGYAFTAAQTMPVLKAAWPYINVNTLAAWSNPDSVFGDLLQASGDGWTIKPDTIASDFVSKNENAFQQRLETWWAPSGAGARISGASTAQDGLFYWAIQGARPRQDCAISVDGAAFGASAGQTDAYGSALLMGASSLAVGSRTLRYKVGAEVFGPYTVDVTAASGGGGAVSSVNGKTGAVALVAADVGAAAASHTHAVGDISATGTASGTTFLRGDGAWAVPAGGGNVSGSGAVTSGALALWGDASGTVIGQVTLSGLLKLSAGVPSVAVAGTDYADPASVVLLTGAQAVGGVKTFSNRSVHAGAYTPSLTPAHSAAPTFDCSTGNVFEPAALTGNVTSITLSNAVAGQTVQIRFQQDATGGRTVTLPGSAKVSGTQETGANRVSWLVLTYSSRGSRWEGNWLQIPN
jgi:lysophospholipase L1-like esterase